MNNTVNKNFAKISVQKRNNLDSPSAFSKTYFKTITF